MWVGQFTSLFLNTHHLWPSPLIENWLSKGAQDLWRHGRELLKRCRNSGRSVVHCFTMRRKIKRCLGAAGSIVCCSEEQLFSHFHVPSLSFNGVLKPTPSCQEHIVRSCCDTLIIDPGPLAMCLDPESSWTIPKHPESSWVTRETSAAKWPNNPQPGLSPRSVSSFMAIRPS